MGRFRSNTTRWSCRLFAVTAVTASLALPAVAQDNPDAAPPRGEQKAQQSEQQSDAQAEHRGENDQSAPQASLGVIAAPSPGNGVLVVGVMPGGPAAEAGLRMGDFILSVEDQKVSQPAELIAALSQKQPSDKVTLVIWRNGEETEKQVQLAARRQGQAGQAWLGIGLRPTEDQQGVEVARLYPNSPAAKADLQEGDVLLAINGDKVGSAQDVIRQIGQASPGDEVELRVQRDGEERTVTVTLASAAERRGGAIRGFGRNFERGLPGGFGPNLPGMRPLPGQGPAFERLEQALQQLQRDMRQLQQQVETLQNQAAGTAVQ